MSNVPVSKISARQLFLNGTWPIFNPSTNPDLGSILNELAVQVPDLFQNFSAILTDGGLITCSPLNTSVILTFTENMKLVLTQTQGLGQQIPQPITLPVVSLSSPIQLNNLDCLIAVIDRTGNTPTAIISVVTNVNQVNINNLDMFVIAVRVDSADGTRTVYFRNGTSVISGQNTRLGGGNGGVPVGTVISSASPNTPAGYLVCDGSSYLISDYPNLAASLYDNVNHKYAWGSVDNTTHFNVPDLRGQFLRGVDGTAGRDPDKTLRSSSNTNGNTGNNVGSIQGNATSTSQTSDPTKNTTGLKNSSSTVTASGSISGTAVAVGNHSHSLTFYAAGTSGANAVGSTNHSSGGGGNTSSEGSHGHDVTGSASVTGSANAQSISGDNETRPVNASVIFLIKY
jgi:Phage Tail Collar Domain